MANAKLKADLVAEDAYWRENFRDARIHRCRRRLRRLRAGLTSTACESFRRYDGDGRHFDDVESRVSSRDWEKFKGQVAPHLGTRQGRRSRRLGSTDRLNSISTSSGALRRAFLAKVDRDRVRGLPFWFQ